ncbi:hypothetical protein RF55_22333, partial [Lasius niger]
NYPQPVITSPGAPTVLRCSSECSHDTPTVLFRVFPQCFHDAPTVPLRVLPRCFYGAPTVPLRVLPRCSSRCSNGAYVPGCLCPTVLRSHGA